MCTEAVVSQTLSKRNHIQVTSLATIGHCLFFCQGIPDTAIEGPLSQRKRSFSLRRLRYMVRYMGQAKTHLQPLLIAVAMNLARLVAWVNGVPRSITRTSTSTALAPG
jgi:Transposase DDE domain